MNKVSDFCRKKLKMKTHLYLKNFSIRTEIGFMLMIVGVQFGTAIRNVFHVEMVNIFMILSVLLICNVANLYHLKFPSWNRYFGLIILFNFVELFYLMFNSDVASETLQYHLYLIASILAISTQNRNLNIRYLSYIIFAVAGFITMVIGYQVTNGFIGVFLENVLYDSETGTFGLAEGGDKITLGRAMLLCIVSCFVFFLKRKYFPILCSGLIALSFIGLFMFSTRASIGCAFLCLFLYLGKKYGFNIFASKRLKLILGVVFILVLGLYVSDTYIQESLDNFVTGTLRGVFTMFGSNEYGIDESTITRYHTMKKAFSFWNAENFSIITMIFGHGYFPFYIDVPVIQAFYDFGCWGFLYFFIMIVLSARYIMKHTHNDAIMIIQLFAVQYLLDQFYCALPYYHFQFMPLVLLLFFYSNNKENFYQIK